MPRFNPWWGCARVSRACRHCYAESTAKRYGHDVWGKNAERRFFGEEHWAEPLRWNAKAEKAGVPMRVFCASMADVFEDHPDLPPHRERLWRLVARTPWLTWQLLTKRPENVAAMVPPLWMNGDWPASVWIGTTTEDQACADDRIPHLVALPAPVRFISAEPLVGPLTLRDEWLVPRANLCQRGPGSAESQAAILDLLKATGRRLGWRGVDWVIAGGESGPGAEPSHPDWFRSLRDQCVAAGVPFLFKQWGAWLPLSDRVELDLPPTNREWRYVYPKAPTHAARGAVVRVGKKAAGRLLDGRQWTEFPARAVATC